MRKYSYESILSAVGRVLDEADVKSFAIRDEEDGLRVDTFTAGSTPELSLNFGLGELVELIEAKSVVVSEPLYERSYAHDEGTLAQFLERHSLVGATR